MSFADYTTTYLEYIKKVGAYLAGQSSAPTLKITINPSKDLNTLRNSVSAENLIYTSNAVYDQMAMVRSLKEIYKKPKEYFAEHKLNLEKETSKTTFLKEEFQRQEANIKENTEASKNQKNLSPILQKKLSLISSDPTNA